MSHLPAPWYTLTELTGRALAWSRLAELRDIDPYLAWADARLFHGMGVESPVTRLPFLVRFSLSSADAATATAAASAITILHGGVVHAYENAAFVAGDVPVDDALDLVPNRLLQIGLPGDPWRWILVDAAAVLALPRIVVRTPQPFTIKIDAAGVERALPPLLAVIDDGCPFAHMAYRRSGTVVGTRVVHLWDQGRDDMAGGLWTEVDGFRYGREIAGAQLDVLMGRELRQGRVDEDGCYRSLGLDELVGAEFTHGAQVLGLVAGAPFPALPEPRPDAAGKAEVIFVQLPRETVRDTSGGSLGRHVLDALRYIDLRATVPGHGGSVVRRPVIVNLSVGAAAGPHDGTSIIEQAIDNFVNERPACAVVMAAGNARNQAMHAQLSVPARSPGMLYWSVRSGDGTDSFLEIWLPRVDDTGNTPRVSVRLVPPGVDAAQCPSTELGGSAFMMPTPDGAAVCGVIAMLSPSNSRSGHVVLCAVAPTAGEYAAATAGVWVIEIFNHGNASIEVDAWIERDDPTFDGPGRQSNFDDASAGNLESGHTLSTLAHGETTIVVGGYRASEDRLLDPDSGEGPGRRGLARAGPELAAPSDESPELPGLLSYGVHSGQWNRMSGTSVAAAVATRRLYNLLVDKKAFAGPRPPTWHAIKALFTPDELADPNVEPPARVGRGRLILKP